MLKDFMLEEFMLEDFMLEDFMRVRHVSSLLFLQKSPITHQ